MRPVFEEQIEKAEKIQDKGLGFQYLLSIQRSVLQYAAVSTIEIYFTSIRETEGIDFNDILLGIHAPNDATSIDILDKLIPAIRNSGWTSFCYGWYESLQDSTTRGSPVPLVQLLQEWINFRNNRPGHGVVDQNTLSQKFDWLVMLAKHTLQCVETALPRLVDDSSLKSYLRLDTPSGQLNLSSLPVVSEDAIVIRNIRNRRGVWSLKYQTLNLDNSIEGEVILEEIVPIISLSNELHHHFVARHFELPDKSWSPLVYLPNRQAVIFEGRTAELEGLHAWLNDLESRACLVFGDGGVGKTTLVLEFLNNLIEDPPHDLKYFPEIICFYTAKLTRWTETGIVYFKGISPAIADAARQIMLAFHERLNKEWYKNDTRSIIDKAVGELAELRLKRNDVLVILDNTETLARKPGEEQELAALIAQISTKLSRVIITSRRREKIEARPIEVLPMNEQTGASLLKRLAIEYAAEPLQSAGDTRLRKLTKNLSGKPLLLDVLARYIGHTGLSIDEALRKILQDAKEGLSEFLYEDVWRRISREQQEAFMVISCLHLPINNLVVGWVCGDIGILHTDWQDAFDETHFGLKTEYGNDYDVEFASMALEFFRVKKQELEKQDRDKIDGIASRIEKKYRDLENAQKEYVSDRVEQAFRTGAARAAKMAANKGQLEDAYIWFLEAIRIDSGNSYLFDRFAWFLMNMMRKIDEARHYAEIACKLDPTSPDAFFTCGLAAYRQLQIHEGDAYMDKAQQNNKPLHLCLMQKGRARLELAKREEDDLRKRTTLLNDAETFLTNARAKIPTYDQFRTKNIETCETLLINIAREKRRKGQLTDKGYVSRE